MARTHGGPARIRRAVLTTAAAAAAAGTIAAPAQAGLLSSTTSLLGQVTTGTVGATTGLLTGDSGLGTLAGAVACPTTTKLADVVPPGPLATPLQQAQFTACMLHFLDFEWRTTHAGGPQLGDRLITTVGVPTPLNMDGDVLPEVMALATPLSINTFQINFRRLDLGLKGDLPGKVELILRDKKGGTLPKEKVAFGLDSRGGRLPDTFNVTATIDSFEPLKGFTSPPRFTFEVSSTVQPQRAAVVADLFDEPVLRGERDSLVTASLGEQPTSWSLKAKIAMREDKGVDGEITTVDRTTLDAAVRMNDPKAEDGSRVTRNLTARLTDLPSSTKFRFQPLAATEPPAGATPEQADEARGGQRFTYAAAQRLTRVDVGYDEDLLRPGAPEPTPLTKGRVAVHGIPTAMSFSQQGSVTAFDVADGTRIDRAEARAALDGELIGHATGRPGAGLLRKEGGKDAEGRDRPDPIALAARIDGIRKVRMDVLGGRTILDLGIAKQPFDLDLRDDVTGLTAKGAVEDLPADGHVEVLPRTRRPDEPAGFEGDPLRVITDTGTGIGEVRATATLDEETGEPGDLVRIKQLQASIKGIPPKIDLTTKGEGDHYVFDTKEVPIGSIEAIARNTKALEEDVTPELTDGSSGVSAIAKKGGPFAARARLVGLEHVDADLAEQDFTVRIGAVPFEARATFDEDRDGEVLERTLRGHIGKLPDEITFDIDVDSKQDKTLTYTASAGLPEVGLQLDGDKLYESAEHPEVAEVDRVRAGIIDAPAEFTAKLAAVGDLDIDATTGVGGMTALVSSKDEEDDPVFQDDRHEVYVENGEEIVVAAQLKGFKRFTYAPKPMDVHFETTADRPLHASGLLDLDEDGTAESGVSADVKDVPAVMDLELAEDGTITYEGSKPITSIAAAAEGLPQLPQLEDVPVRLDEVSAAITGVPRKLTAKVADGAYAFKATDEHGNLQEVGAIEARAATEEEPTGLQAVEAGSYVRGLREGGKAVLELKAAHLRELDLKTEPLDVTVDTGVLSAFDVDVRDNDADDDTLERYATAKLRGQDIDRVTVKQETLSDGRSRITADTGRELQRVEAHVMAKPGELPLGITTADVEVLGIPEVARITTAAEGAASDLLEVKALRRSGDQLVEDARGIDRITASINGGAPDQTVETVGRGTVPSDGVKAEVVDGEVKQAGVVLSGLRGFAFQSKPFTQVEADVVPAQSRPLAIDATMDGKTAKGVVDKLPEDMVLKIGPRADTPIEYDALQPIKQIKLTATGLLAEVPKATLDVRDVPAQFETCYATDGSKASCQRDNRFSGRSNRKLAVAFITNKAAGQPQTTVTGQVCFTADCAQKFDVDVTVPNHLQFEVGASATPPSIPSVEFDCLDGLEDIFLGVPCIIDFAVTALNKIANSASIKAWVWFDTDASKVDVDGQFETPVGGPMDPLKLTLDLPEVSAQDAFADLDVRPLAFSGAFDTGGAMTCAQDGATLTASTRFFWDTPDIDWDTPELLKPVLPDAVIDHIEIPNIDVPISLPIIPELC